MKTEILAAHDAAQTALTALKALLDSLPNDPAALAPVPTGLAVAYGYVMGSPAIPEANIPDSRVLVLGLNWNDTAPNTVRLSVKGAETNPAGPQEWTPIDYNGSGPDEHSVRQAYVLQNPAGQVILFRLTAVNSDNIESDPCEITVNADDYLPS